MQRRLSLRNPARGDVDLSESRVGHREDDPVRDHVTRDPVEAQAVGAHVATPQSRERSIQVKGFLRQAVHDPIFRGIDEGKREHALSYVEADRLPGARAEVDHIVRHLEGRAQQLAKPP